jgi:hypothetical protein
MHQASIEHLTGYLDFLQKDDSPLRKSKDAGLRATAADYVDDAKIPGIVEKTRASGSWNCPTLTVLTKFLPLEEGKAELARPEMRFLPPVVRASWDPTKDFRLKTMNAEHFAALRRRDAVGARLVKALRDAGARLLLGTDFPNPFVVPGFSIHEELARLVGAGLTPYEALRSGTKDAAEYLKDDFGQVLPGMRADLVLVNKNPLEDVKRFADRRGVMVRGVYYEEADLAARLEALTRAFDPSIPRIGKLPTPSAGERIAAPRSMTARFSGVFTGEERLAADRAAEGHRVLFAQSVYDEVEAASAVVDAREELDGLGHLVAVEMSRDNWNGNVRAKLRVEGGRVRGSLELAGEPKVTIDQPLADAVFVTTVAGTLQLVVDRAKSLAVAKELTIAAKDVEIEPTLRLVDVVEKVKRLPDADGLRRYAVDEERRNGKTHAEVTVGKDGQVRAALLTLQIGEIARASND